MKDINKRLRDTLAQVVGSDDPEELQAMRLLLSDAKEKGGDIDDGVLAAIDVLLETSVATTKPVAAEPESALDIILAERRRQIAKGYDSKHDDEHANGELAAAAAAFAAVEGAVDGETTARFAPDLWPFDVVSYDMERPSLDNLACAGALIVAEMERRLRTVRNGWQAAPAPATSPAPVAEPAPSLQQRARAWGSARREPYSDHEGLQVFNILVAIYPLIYRAIHPRPELWRVQGDAQQTSILVDAAIALLTIADLRELDLVAEIERRIAK